MEGDYIGNPTTQANQMTVMTDNDVLYNHFYGHLISKYGHNNAINYTQDSNVFISSLNRIGTFDPPSKNYSLPYVLTAPNLYTSLKACGITGRTLDFFDKHQELANHAMLDKMYDTIITMSSPEHDYRMTFDLSNGGVLTFSAPFVSARPIANAEIPGNLPPNMTNFNDATRVIVFPQQQSINSSMNNETMLPIVPVSFHMHPVLTIEPFFPDETPKFTRAGAATLFTVDQSGTITYANSAYKKTIRLLD
jgi:hypothetical protein